mmetsp:Transcript_45196/g.108963  ORF Transcript_45196/g.108963 Transcript_45196/m.108963 type:complete len:472 (+) Transcript_45196:687-2102(+)
MARRLSVSSSPLSAARHASRPSFWSSARDSVSFKALEGASLKFLTHWLAVLVYSSRKSMRFPDPSWIVICPGQKKFSPPGPWIWMPATMAYSHLSGWTETWAVSMTSLTMHSYAAYVSSTRVGIRPQGMCARSSCLTRDCSMSVWSSLRPIVPLFISPKTPSRAPHALLAPWRCGRKHWPTWPSAERAMCGATQKTYLSFPSTTGECAIAALKPVLPQKTKPASDEMLKWELHSESRVSVKGRQSSSLHVDTRLIDVFFVKPWLFRTEDICLIKSFSEMARGKRSSSMSAKSTLGVSKAPSTLVVLPCWGARAKEGAGWGAAVRTALLIRFSWTTRSSRFSIEVTKSSSLMLGLLKRLPTLPVPRGVSIVSVWAVCCLACLLSLCPRSDQRNPVTIPRFGCVILPLFKQEKRKGCTLDIWNRSAPQRLALARGLGRLEHPGPIFLNVLMGSPQRLSLRPTGKGRVGWGFRG